MPQSFTLNVNHSLGAEVARQRIESGIAQFRNTLGSQLSVLEETWINNHLDFRVGFMGQMATGILDVGDTVVRLEVLLPGLLGFFANKVQSLVRKKGQLLLGHEQN
jgi:Putative polyhydroxyalkanoic acid system protein (PHA_gran_rgn)